jgi:hypothetical protein
VKGARLLLCVAAVAGVSLLLQREFVRGTFDPVERAFVGWLSANTGAKNALPPLTLVLYDDEASNLAGSTRMGALDAALFARAVSKLGAAAAGVEGLPGDPSRMVEAAGRMPVFAGYAPDNPPGMGWTPCVGVPGAKWFELRGLAGPAATRIPRGFFTAPEGGSGPRRALIVARNADCVVPSFLALSWAAGQRLKTGQVFVDGNRLRAPHCSVPIDVEGKTAFFPAAPAGIISMNELLVAAEKYERGEGDSPLRGRVVVLARATADVTRLKNSPQSIAATPSELWAESWAALSRGRCFLLPGWWYQVVLVAAVAGLALALRGRTWPAMAGAGSASLLFYLLIALGAFASVGILLPFVLSAGTLVAGLLLGRLILKT